MATFGLDPKFFYEAGSHFTAGVGDRMSSFASGMNFKKNIAEGATEFLKNMGKGGGKGFSEGLDEFLKNANFGNAGKGFSKEFNDFFANLKFAKAGEAFGREFNDMFGKATGPMNEAFFKAFSDLGSQISWAFISRWAPTFLGFSALSVGIPLTIQYLYHKMVYNIGRPKLAIKERRVSMFTPFIDGVRDRINSLFGSNPPKIAPIFNEEITRKIGDITAAIPNIQKNNGYFQNIILYGPGGTGKTMICEKIAKDANVNFVMMSGGDLAQYIKRGEHVTELNRLFDRVESSSVPTVLFIDEAESFAKDRGEIKTSQLLELQNAFLNRTGTQSKKLIIVMATNRIDDIDPAVLSRMDFKIEVPNPALAQRVSILKMYAPHFFSQTEEQQLFSDKQIAAIAAKTDGLSGRTLFKMLNAMSCKKTANTNNQLTQAMVDQTVDDFAKQEKEIGKRKPHLPGASLPKSAPAA